MAFCVYGVNPASCRKRGFCPPCGARRMADSAAHLVDHVFPDRSARQWVLSVPYQLRFLFAAQPQVITKVLAIVHRVISTWLIKRAGLTVKSGAQTGAVTLLQHFGSALNAHLHFHMVYIDGVFDRQGHFHPLKGPTLGDLDSITHQIAQRVSRYLEKAGYLVRDAESAYLDLPTDNDDAMVNIVGASISYRLAFGPNAGLGAPEETLSPCRRWLPETPTTCGRWPARPGSKQSGFSLHAGVSCKAGQQKKLERL